MYRGGTTSSGKDIADLFLTTYNKCFKELSIVLDGLDELSKPDQTSVIE